MDEVEWIFNDLDELKLGIQIFRKIREPKKTAYNGCKIYIKVSTRKKMMKRFVHINFNFLSFVILLE